MGRFVITGGGTGGHLYPMLAVADALVDSGVAISDIRLVGSSRGEDRKILAGSRYRCSYWPGRGVRRSLHPRDLVATARALVGIGWSFVLGIATAAIWRPDVVVSVGGYASLPMSVGAVVTRRPLVLVELDAATGLAHRLVVRFCAKRCTAFEISDPRAVWTGAPVRKELASQPKNSAERSHVRARMVPPIDPTKTVVLAMTGSLGARSVNDAVAALAKRWADRSDVTLIHVTGRRDYAVYANADSSARLDYRVIEFADMTELWGAADIAICRAGATTVAELAVVGVPAVLVPLPNSPSDHQGENARTLERAGAAIVLEDKVVSDVTLDEALRGLFDAEVREKMSQALLRLGRPAAASAIAKVVIEEARR